MMRMPCGHDESPGMDVKGGAPWWSRWLRKDRWFADEYRANQSRHQYAVYAVVEGRAPPDRYGTSILGVLNGYLPMVGFVLVECSDEQTGKRWLEVRRKWWK